MTLFLNCQTILWPIRHSGHAVWAAWCWREKRFACLSQETAYENYLDCAYSVIDGHFFKDELVSLKLRLDDSAALRPDSLRWRYRG